MPLITTVGSATANSFMSLAEFKAYLGERTNVPAVVSGATDPQMEAGLIQAARHMAWHMCWTGAVVDNVQALPWPRTGMTNRYGFTIATDTIPVDIKYFQAELTIALLTKNRLVENAAQAAGLTKLAVGPVELRFKQDYSDQVMVVPQVLKDMLPEGWMCPEEELNAIFHVIRPT